MLDDPRQSDVLQFVDDDEGYLQWVHENPVGYVVNSNRKPTSSYVILHRADCRHINSPNRSNWTNDYIKTCSLDVAVLEAWAHSTTGGPLTPCDVCKPLSEKRTVNKPTESRSARSRAPASLPAEHQAKRSPTLIKANRTIPADISTGCPELDLVWREYATDILNRPHVLIPDTDDELNWHAFLGHSIDMQGFRAAEFSGVDPLTKKAPRLRIAEATRNRSRGTRFALGSQRYSRSFASPDTRSAIADNSGCPSVKRRLDRNFTCRGVCCISTPKGPLDSSRILAEFCRAEGLRILVSQLAERRVQQVG